MIHMDFLKHNKTLYDLLYVEQGKRVHKGLVENTLRYSIWNHKGRIYRKNNTKTKLGAQFFSTRFDILPWLLTNPYYIFWSLLNALSVNTSPLKERYKGPLKIAHQNLPNLHQRYQRTAWQNLANNGEYSNRIKWYFILFFGE